MRQKREKVKNRVQLEMGAASKSGEGMKHQDVKHQDVKHTDDSCVLE